MQIPASPSPRQLRMAYHWCSTGSGDMRHILSMVGVPMGHQNQIRFIPRSAWNQGIQPTPMKVLAWIDDDALVFCLDEESVVSIVS